LGSLEPEVFVAEEQALKVHPTALEATQAMINMAPHAPYCDFEVVEVEGGFAVVLKPGKVTAGGKREKAVR
jgi:hypothetical protein